MDIQGKVNEMLCIVLSNVISYRKKESVSKREVTMAKDRVDQLIKGVYF